MQASTVKTELVYILLFFQDQDNIGYCNPTRSKELTYCALFDEYLSQSVFL